MPLPARDLNDGPDIKVLILNAKGQYLAGDRTHWFFTEDRAAAVVLHRRADHVLEQLEQLRKSEGVVLKAVPVPLQEIYETCDRCQELFMPFMVFFDGTRFLCAECRSRAARRPARAERRREP